MRYLTLSLSYSLNILSDSLSLSLLQLLRARSACMIKSTFRV